MKATTCSGSVVVFRIEDCIVKNLTMLAWATQRLFNLYLDKKVACQVPEAKQTMGLAAAWPCSSQVRRLLTVRH